MQPQHKGLILIAHGSRNLASNQQTIDLTASLASLVKDKYTQLNHAFLEFADPSIENAVKTQIQAGMTHIVLFPYFLSNGNHVSQDIPLMIGRFQHQYPLIRFTILPAFGLSPDIVELISHLL
jgi:sirohydrochlorin ferrochelatase